MRYISTIKILIILLFTSGCSDKSLNVNDGNQSIVFTAVPKASEIQAKYPEAAKIFILKEDSEEPEYLTESFYSARSPEVSYNGSKLLFTAQKNQGDLWQIWELDFNSKDISQITTRSANCTDPAYLPDGRIVFSSSSQYLKDIEGILALFTINRDGTEEKQITFHPNSDQNPTIFSDGRILINSSQLYPERKSNLQLVLRPDGTKAEMFYRPLPGAELISRGWETQNGQYVFTQQSNSGQTQILSVNQNRPLNPEIDLSEGLSGEFHSVFPIKGEYIVSSRQENQAQYSLYRLNQSSKELELIYKNEEFHVIEPVAVQNRALPKRLPSRIIENNDMGIVLCLNADMTQDALMNNAITSTVEVHGVKTSFGKIPVAKDGSFYLKVPSNTPLRFQTYDSMGHLINGPSDWIWVRPGERRGCIGCHEDKELSPENRVPLAVSDKPYNILKNKKSKGVEE